MRTWRGPWMARRCATAAARHGFSMAFHSDAVPLPDAVPLRERGEQPGDTLGASVERGRRLAYQRHGGDRGRVNALGS